MPFPSPLSLCPLWLSGWLSSEDDPLGYVDRIDRRIEDFTGLTMSTAEQLQVNGTLPYMRTYRNVVFFVHCWVFNTCVTVEVFKVGTAKFVQLAKFALKHTSLYLYQFCTVGCELWYWRAVWASLRLCQSGRGCIQRPWSWEPHRHCPFLCETSYCGILELR